MVLYILLTSTVDPCIVRWNYPDDDVPYERSRQASIVPRPISPHSRFSAKQGCSIYPESPRLYTREYYMAHLRRHGTLL